MEGNDGFASAGGARNAGRSVVIAIDELAWDG